MVRRPHAADSTYGGQAATAAREIFWRSLRTIGGDGFANASGAHGSDHCGRRAFEARVRIDDGDDMPFARHDVEASFARHDGEGIHPDGSITSDINDAGVDVSRPPRARQ